MPGSVAGGAGKNSQTAGSSGRRRRSGELAGQYSRARRRARRLRRCSYSQRLPEARARASSAIAQRIGKVSSEIVFPCRRLLRLDVNSTMPLAAAPRPDDEAGVDEQHERCERAADHPQRPHFGDRRGRRERHRCYPGDRCDSQAESERELTGVGGDAGSLPWRASRFRQGVRLRVAMRGEQGLPAGHGLLVLGSAAGQPVDGFGEAAGNEHPLNRRSRVERLPGCPVPAKQPRRCRIPGEPGGTDQILVPAVGAAGRGGPGRRRRGRSGEGARSWESRRGR